VLICSCSDDLMETTESNVNVSTRATAEVVYHFEASSEKGFSDTIVNNEINANIYCGQLHSYKEIGDSVVDVEPVVAYAPSWVDVYIIRAYTNYYHVVICVQANDSDKRVDQIKIKQPGSNKVKSFNVTQESYYNNADVAVKWLSTGKYEITVTTQYPAQEGTVFTFDYTTYNGEEYKDYFNILTFKQDATTASLIVDYSKDVIYTGYMGLCLTKVGCNPSDSYHYVTNITTPGYIYY